VVNACALDHWKAELARAMQPPVQDSAPGTFVFSDLEGNHVINGISGTLTGNFRAWTFVGQGVPSWNNTLRATMRCRGALDAGVRADPGASGRMHCRADWVEAGRTRTWDCTGAGASRVVWSIGDWWFADWPGSCVGTATRSDGTVASAKFGLVGVKSALGSH
jgi:hypothetical protein